MRQKTKALFAWLLILPFILCACSRNPESVEEEGTSYKHIVKEAPQDINSVHLRENKLIYSYDDDNSVVTMYLTVMRGNAAENTNHSWEEINTYSVYDYEEMGVERYQIAGLLQVGNENGPMPGELGFADIAPNATVQVRGQTSSSYKQKNYKIELKENKGLWHEQKTINLNKHSGESLRFRNKLAYDLLEEIPQLIGLRTQFVHLYVNDETGSEPGVFKDYGLYTQVEQLNKRAMKKHGLDTQGQLYKLNMIFEFFRYEDAIKLTTDPSYDEDAFSYYLETKGNANHQKLIAMLEALNDTSTPLDTVLNTYFDEENLTYWLAYQILIGNVDTQSRNTYLYSPSNSDTWYLIPWDNDTCLMREEYRLKGRTDQGSWEIGVSNYWGNVLFQRCLKSEAFRRKLEDAIMDLKTNYITAEKLAQMIEGYRLVVDPFVGRMPDLMNLGLKMEDRNKVIENLPSLVEKNYQLYLESMECPMPFYIGTPFLENGRIMLTWDVAFDFNAEDITYTCEVAADYSYENPLLYETGIIIPEAEMDALPDGQYFIRVRATNSSGKTQDAFDTYSTDRGFIYGTRCFYIIDGEIVEEEYVEG